MTHFQLEVHIAPKARGDVGRENEGRLEPELLGVAIGCGGHVVFAGVSTLQISVFLYYFAPTLLST